MWQNVAGVTGCKQGDAHYTRTSLNGHKPRILNFLHEGKKSLVPFDGAEKHVCQVSIEKTRWAFAILTLIEATRPVTGLTAETSAAGWWGEASLQVSRSNDIKIFQN